MEQSKWIIVRRESTFEIFKRKLKKLFFFNLTLIFCGYSKYNKEKEGDGFW